MRPILRVAGHATVLALIVLAASLTWAAPQVRLECSAETSRVVAEGLTPGTTAVLFSVAKERPRWMTRVVPRHRIEHDADGDGAVEFLIEGKISPHSVWFVVDLTTGEHGVAVPEGFPSKEVDLPGNGLPRGAGGLVRVLHDTRGDVEMLLVRPAEGAWVFSASDGGTNDEDGVSNGTIRAAFDRMQPLGETVESSPTNLLPEDVVVVIDPISLEFYATRFPRGEQ